MDVSVVIGTYGAPIWARLADMRAAPSAARLGVPVIRAHEDSLHEARNEGLDQVKTEWVCHLDADDELEPGFFEEIEAVEGDLRGPAVRYTRSGFNTPARMPKVSGHTHMCEADCLLIGNWLVVGTVVRADLVRAVGGWKPYPVYEDFDLWQRCWVAGVTVTAVPKAVYRAHRSPRSRNNSMSPGERRLVHYEIAKTNLPDRDWEWLRA